MQAAGSIFNWLTDFAENPKGRKILSSVGAVIFCPTYPEGKLTEGKDRYIWLSYDRKGILRYRESNGGIRFLQNKVLANPQQMVRRRHPNYILSFHPGDISFAWISKLPAAVYLNGAKTCLDNGGH
jgi:hypothetical protein